eukprot:12080326-Alexandrium_andersonii.AAC.1
MPGPPRTPTCSRKLTLAFTWRWSHRRAKPSSGLTAPAATPSPTPAPPSSARSGSPRSQSWHAVAP